LQTEATELEVAQLLGCSAEDAGTLVDQVGEVTKLQHKSIKF
jgi:hypothetical protein